MSMFEGMNQMFANMLKEAIPKEVIEMLAPEKVKEFGDKVNAFVIDVRERLDRIENYSHNTYNLVDMMYREQTELLKRIEERQVNDNGNSGRKPAGKRAAIGNDSGSGAGTGNGAD